MQYVFANIQIITNYLGGFGYFEIKTPPCSANITQKGGIGDMK